MAGENMYTSEIPAKTSPVTTLKNETRTRKEDPVQERHRVSDMFDNESIIELAFRGRSWPAHFLWCIGHFYGTSDLFFFREDSFFKPDDQQRHVSDLCSREEIRYSIPMMDAMRSSRVHRDKFFSNPDAHCRVIYRASAEIFLLEVR